MLTKQQVTMKVVISVLCFIALAGSAYAVLHERDLNPILGPSLLGGVPIVDPPKRVAGYFDLNRTHDAKMFYFFFESRTQSSTDPVVLWMTGGPGCSSELAVFFENGPFAINKDLSLNETKNGWDTNTNMIFVDQPINSGFSFSDDERDRVHDEVGVADDMLDFLQAFFAKHPEFADRDFYVTGESYAGHYVPSVSHRVWLAKKNGEGKPINIKGLAIGNGLTDPAIQYGAYADYALQNKLISQGLHDRIQFLYPVCRVGAQICAGHDWKVECLLALQFCQVAIFESIMMAAGNINVYDIRKECKGALCYEEFQILDKFLNQKSIRDALGVGDRRWEACSPSVYQDMMGDWMKQYDNLLPEMLADGVRVMIYAGDQDFICNWLGNRRWVDALEWHGADDWAAEEDFEWSVHGKPAGMVRESGGLTFVQVYQAGHMVPMDQPENGLDMITRFTRSKSFRPPTATAAAKSHRLHLPHFPTWKSQQHEVSTRSRKEGKF